MIAEDACGFAALVLFCSQNDHLTFVAPSPAPLTQRSTEKDAFLDRAETGCRSTAVVAGPDWT